MFNAKEIKELKEDVVKEGAEFHIDFAGLTTEEFAMKILILINVKSSRREVGIVDIRTFEDSNLIQVQTKDKEHTYHVLRQLVDNDEQITEVDKLQVLEVDRFELSDVMAEVLGVSSEDFVSSTVTLV